MRRPAYKWRLDRRARLHWRHFDGEWVVYEAGSGDTHQLDPISAAVLMFLESESQDTKELADVIATELQLPRSDDLANRIEDVLEQFVTIGLIEPLSP